MEEIYKQKEGKKRMRQIGNVEVPQKAFMSVLKINKDQCYKRLDYFSVIC